MKLEIPEYCSTGGLGIAIIYGYFVIGVIVNKFLISPMVKWNGRVEKAEGDFRYYFMNLFVLSISNNDNYINFFIKWS